MKTNVLLQQGIQIEQMMYSTFSRNSMISGGAFSVLENLRFRKRVKGKGAMPRDKEGNMTSRVVPESTSKR